MPIFAGKKREEFQVVLLDRKNRVMKNLMISHGSLTASVVHPREVFNPAIRESAAAIICVHNHPSGDPQPSQEDRVLTTRLAQAGQLLGIQMLDHIIVGRDTYMSFADEGLLDNGR
jgi:DNA repair protein RadC